MNKEPENVFEDEGQEDDYEMYDDDDDPDKDPHMSSEVNVASPASQDMYNESFQAVDDSYDDSAQPESEHEPETEAPKIVKRKKLNRDSLKRRILANLDEGGRLDEIIRPVDNTQTRFYRRSKRNRVRPLNYWSGQRALYKYEVDLKGNQVSTLVGVSTESMEPRRPMRMRPLKKKRVENDEVSGC